MSSIPRINKEQVLNIVEKEDGCFIIPRLEHNNEQININASAYQMFKLIDGKLTLKQICEKLISIYNGADYEEMYNDVLYLYMSLWHLGIISWDNNPCLDDYRKIVGDYSVEITSVDTVETFMFLVAKNDQEYVTPFRYREHMVKQIDIEQAIVNNSTQQFVVKKGEDIILSTIVRIDIKEVSYIIDYMACDKSFFSMPDEILFEIMKWIREKINSYVQGFISKHISTYTWEIPVLKEDVAWQEYLEKKDYSQKVDLKNEAIDGDVTIFYFTRKTDK